ncbi:hypothetical protein DPMN_021192 [Dreissena polymorpha]|uniref:Uncharacterized protein n=1 Tax=Dreissena polymorpha TaxID=45954 RepID=A0A9D4NLR9_DREPO|nr:hypothetical protein DPMN_021192 [Dreissena polymorpha]
MDLKVELCSIAAIIESTLNRQTDGQTDGRTDRQKYIFFLNQYVKNMVKFQEHRASLTRLASLIRLEHGIAYKTGSLHRLLDWFILGIAHRLLDWFIVHGRHRLLDWDSVLDWYMEGIAY